MYTVVVCTECQFCWIVQDRPERTKCGRCSKSHQFKKLRKFHTAEEKQEAKRARATVRAEVIGDVERFEREKQSGSLTVEFDSSVDGSAYLDEAELEVDEDALAAVAERASSGPSSRSKSRKEIVRDAVAAGGVESVEDVVSYAVARDVDAAAAEKTFEKLRRAGEVILSGGEFRVV